MFSLVVPSYNESDNIDSLIASVSETLAAENLDYEIIIVDDDSPDGTADRALLWRDSVPIRVIQRKGERGLASAVIAGWAQAKGDILGVMDCDGSHDVRILPLLVKAVQCGRTDLSIGSRYIRGGGVKDWPLYRQFISRFAVALARPICKVKDSTSGYFVLKKCTLENVALKPEGFKIGLEVLVKGRYQKFVEIPYTFRDRQAGESKLNQRVVLEYLKQLKELYLWFLSHSPKSYRVHLDEL